MKTTKKYNEDYVRQMIMTNDKWLFKAVIAIFDRQTSDEKYDEQTRYHNKRGFTHADAKRMTYYAKWILRNGQLTGNHLAIARKRMSKYVGQLTRIANEKPSKESTSTTVLVAPVQKQDSVFASDIGILGGLWPRTVDFEGERYEHDHDQVSNDEDRELEAVIYRAKSGRKLTVWND